MKLLCSFESGRHSNKIGSSADC